MTKKQYLKNQIKKVKKIRANMKFKPKCMITEDRGWIRWRFEYDVGDGNGLLWRSGRSCGPQETVESCVGHFTKKGYNIISWEHTDD